MGRNHNTYMPSLISCATKKKNMFINKCHEIFQVNPSAIIGVQRARGTFQKSARPVNNNNKKSRKSWVFFPKFQKALLRVPVGRSGSVIARFSCVEPSFNPVPNVLLHFNVGDQPNVMKSSQDLDHTNHKHFQKKSNCWF